MGKYLDMIAAKLQDEAEDFVDYELIGDAMSLLSNDMGFVTMSMNLRCGLGFDAVEAEKSILRCYRGLGSRGDMRACCNAFVQMLDNPAIIADQLAELTQGLLRKYD